MLVSCAGGPSKPRYLSDSDPAYAALEAYQKSIFVAEPLATRWVGSRENIDKMKASLKQHRNQNLKSKLDYDVDQARIIEDSLTQFVKMKLPTRFENPMAYSLISIANYKVTNAAAEAYIKLPAHLRFGTLATTNMNAQILQFPGVSDPVVVINEKTFLVTQLLLTSALDTVDIRMAGNGKFEVKSRLGKNLKETHVNHPEMLMRFHRAILFLIDVNNLEKIQLSPYSMLHETLSDGVDFFIVAHEYGHLIKQHTPVAFQALLPRIGLKEALHSWDQEIEADQFAMELLTKNLERDGLLKLGQFLYDAQAGRLQGNEQLRMALNTCKLTSPLLLFRFHEIIEEAEYIKQHGELPPPPPDIFSHQLVEKFTTALRAGYPPSALRQALIMRGLDELRGEALVDQPDQKVMDAYELGWFLERNLGELWNQAKPMLPGLIRLALEQESPEATPSSH